MVLAMAFMGFAFSAYSQARNATDPLLTLDSFEAPTDSLEVLITALEASDLFDMLENRGDFTVFAPSNAAFDQMGQHKIFSLFKPENKSNLKSLMSYHIVPGKLTASGILKALCQGKGATSFTTIQGEELLASMDGTDIILMDCSGNKARITSADSAQRNLVFHRIDKVVSPLPHSEAIISSTESSAGRR